MPRHDSTTRARWTVLLALALLPACGEKSPPPPSADAVAEKAAAEAARAAKELSREIESFTGARTRIVWSQFQKTDSTDPRSNKSGHFLMGLDSQDGLGARPLIAKEDNYSRPLLSTDGEVILYTRKTVTWDAQDVKHYTAVIMRTDWKGSLPVEISDGYAVDVWRDPATRIEWVYAVRDLIPSPLVAIEARKLVRFQLKDPDEQELVWDQTKVSPDNIQLSRDGRRASGQFPWPQAGLFVLEEKKSIKKLQEGAWPSLAPDNSYAASVLDAAHKSLTLFVEGEEKPWTVPLTTTPDLAKGEVNHPGWSNHPRFISLTGPYLPATDPSEGSALGRGGLTSEVFIGKFSARLDKIESWLRITSNGLNDNQPDVWIEGGDTVELKDFAQVHELKPVSPPWLSDTEGLIFRWENAAAKNTVDLSGGRQIDCGLDLHGGARYGRHQEMLLDAGPFVLRPDAAGIVTDAVQSAIPLALEFILRIDGDPKAAFGTLATFPHLRLTLRDGIISAETSAGIIGIGPVQGAHTHLTASSGDKGYSFVLQEADGQSMTKISAARPRAVPGRGAVVSFGGTGGRGIAMSHAAVYARALTPAEIRDRLKILAALDVTPPSATLKLRGKLLRASPMPAADTISPGTRALIACLYEVVRVTEGDYTAGQILVKHWSLMDGKPVLGLPRKTGLEYDLIVQPLGDHPQLEGIRAMPLEAPGLDPWFDIHPPAVGR